jgi:hypothetical protein
MHRRGLQSADSEHDDNADGAPFQKDERNFFEHRHLRRASMSLECWKQAIIRDTRQSLDQRD